MNSLALELEAAASQEVQLILGPCQSKRSNKVIRHDVFISFFPFF